MLVKCNTPLAVFQQVQRLQPLVEVIVTHDAPF